MARIAKKWLADLSKMEGKKKSKRATVVLLFGDLGSGKTTFAQAVAREFGIKSRVTSPTFVIQKRYAIPQGRTLRPPKGSTFKKWPWQKLIHLDCYRLAGGHEVENLGWREITDNSENLILIEWPDMIASALPKLSEKIHFKFIDEKTRSLDFKPWPKVKKNRRQ